MHRSRLGKQGVSMHWEKAAEKRAEKAAPPPKCELGRDGLLPVGILRIFALLLHNSFPVACQVVLERFDVLVETKCTHRPQDIVTVYGLSFLALALVGGLRGNETDKLGHAFLHGILAVLCDFRVSRQRLLHDSGNVRCREVLVLFADPGISFLLLLILRHCVCWLATREDSRATVGVARKLFEHAKWTQTHWAFAAVTVIWVGAQKGFAVSTCPILFKFEEYASSSLGMFDAKAADGPEILFKITDLRITKLLLELSVLPLVDTDTVLQRCQWGIFTCGDLPF